MTEQEILDKIKASAESVEIPERLNPKQIELRLKEQKQPKRFQWRAMHLVAAATVLVVLLGVIPIPLLQGRGYCTAEKRSDNVQEREESVEEEEVTIEKKRDAGSLYLVAESYDEVQTFLNKNLETIRNYTTGIEDLPMDKLETMTDGAAADINLPMESVSIENSAEEEKAVAHSATNLQMAGVDESDIVKTDGSYIFIVKDGMVKIVELQEGQMTLVGSISPQMESFSDRVLEMYVDKDRLFLITQQVEESLDGKEMGGYRAITEKQKEACVDVAYQLDACYNTRMYTYDISNPAKAKQIGKIEQEGSYQSSRKIGDMVYLFTQKNIALKTETSADSEGEIIELLPKVNGETVSYDSIYLPKQGTSGLFVSSIAVDNPNAVVDSTFILNNYVEIYVSNNALYLYHLDYSKDTPYTQIAKFALEEGRIFAQAAASVPGRIEDTFAINEYKGNLRVLTSYWDNRIGENTNQLYILDENLKPMGKIEHIAEGETIYSARYLGDLAYFITYRNIDPLFAADLSDIQNPKILGELKITGYSEYLHMWGEDKLLGIGYETDEKDGSREGIKLVMFDISNPSKLSILDTVVLKEADYSAALYHYKCVLADTDTNMIGFTTIHYQQDKLNYHVYSFQNGKFEEALTVCEEDIYGEESYRGLWAGDYFYLVSQEEVKSYAYENEYQAIDTLEL